MEWKIDQVGRIVRRGWVSVEDVFCHGFIWRIRVPEISVDGKSQMGDFQYNDDDIL